MFHVRTKHIKVHHHFIQEKITNEEVFVFNFYEEPTSGYLHQTINDQVV